MVKEKNFQKDFIAFLKMFHTGRVCLSTIKCSERSPKSAVVSQHA